MITREDEIILLDNLDKMEELRKKVNKICESYSWQDIADHPRLEVQAIVRHSKQYNVPLDSARRTVSQYRRQKVEEIR
jgi:hypothetical protein